MRFITLLLLSSSLFGWEHSDWLKEIKNRSDQKAIAWLKEQLKQEKKNHSEEDLPLLNRDSCKNCVAIETKEIENPQLYIFMSFSIPETIWLALSKEMENYPAVFVLRGLPNKSFRVLARKIADLKEKGMEASIVIHPQLFKQYQVNRVPSFVFCDNKGTDKFSGATSIGFAQDTRKSKERMSVQQKN